MHYAHNIINVNNIIIVMLLECYRRYSHTIGKVFFNTFLTDQLMMYITAIILIH